VPEYRETGELLSRVRRELARPPKVKIPDLSWTLAIFERKG
jgi:hypothetical protein